MRLDAFLFQKDVKNIRRITSGNIQRWYFLHRLSEQRLQSGSNALRNEVPCKRTRSHEHPYEVQTQIMIRSPTLSTIFLKISSIGQMTIRCCVARGTPGWFSCLVWRWLWRLWLFCTYLAVAGWFFVWLGPALVWTWGRSWTSKALSRIWSDCREGRLVRRASICRLCGTWWRHRVWRSWCLRRRRGNLWTFIRISFRL